MFRSQNNHLNTKRGRLGAETKLLFFEEFRGNPRGQSSVLRFPACTHIHIYIHTYIHT